MKSRQPQFANRLLQLEYLRTPQSHDATTRLLMVCRQGRLFGADEKGAVYSGTLDECSYAPQARAVINLAGETPQDDQSAVPRAANATINVSISGEIDTSAPAQRTTIAINGEPVEAVITNLGLLRQ